MTMEQTTTTSKRGRTPGFKGVRNEDTRAATAASVASRQRKALDRQLLAAQALLEQHEHIVITPYEQDWLKDDSTDHEALKWIVTAVAMCRRELWGS